MKLDEFIKFNPKESLSKGKCFKCVDMASLKPFTRKPDHFISIYKNGSKFRNGDTIMARITPCLENGKTSYINFLQQNEVAFGSTEFIVARAKTNVSLPLFIYYLLCSNRIREIAIGSMTGSSGRERVQQISLNEIEIPAYSISFQQHIVDIIGTIDDLIENLQSQSINLIKIISHKVAIFENNNVGNRFSNCFRCYNGFAFKSSDYTPSGNWKVITIKNVNDDGFDSTSSSKIEMKDDYVPFKLNIGDIVLTMTGNVGRVGVVDDHNCLLNQRVLKIMCCSPSYLLGYLITHKNEIARFGKANDDLYAELVLLKMKIRKLRDMKKALLSKYFSSN